MIWQSLYVCFCRTILRMHLLHMGVYGSQLMSSIMHSDHGSRLPWLMFVSLPSKG